MKTDEKYMTEEEAKKAGYLETIEYPITEEEIEKEGLTSQLKEFRAGKESSKESRE